MYELTTAIEIEAPAETVWQVLTDLEHFHEWNPFIRQARGGTTVGSTVDVAVAPSYGLRLAFHANVLACEENHVLRWRGQVFAPWLACGDHAFTLEPLGDQRCRFVQHEVFSGLLPRLARRLVEREALRGFHAMDQAIKVRAERARSVASSARAAS